MEFFTYCVQYIHTIERNLKRCYTHTPTVYLNNYHCRSHYLGTTSYATKKLNNITFYGESRFKGDQAVHEHLLYNTNCTENYNDCRFKILSTAINLYNL